jgi:periplasmic copper chaperone A
LRKLFDARIHSLQYASAFVMLSERKDPKNSQDRWERPMGPFALMGRGAAIVFDLVARTIVFTIAFVCLPTCVVLAGSLQISKAWTPEAEIGGDAPLLMTIANQGSEADNLLRARCSVANFLEKHTVDRGEGAPAMRVVSSIPVPPNQTITLTPGSYHLMLLQLRQALVIGQHFVCSAVFAKTGVLDIEVEVALGEPH